MIDRFDSLRLAVAEWPLDVSKWLFEDSSETGRIIRDSTLALDSAATAKHLEFLDALPKDSIQVIELTSGSLFGDNTAAA